MHCIDEYGLEVFKDECLSCCSGFVVMLLLMIIPESREMSWALYLSRSLISSDRMLGMMP
jgi:hypothetical protein